MSSNVSTPSVTFFKHLSISPKTPQKFCQFYLSDYKKYEVFKKMYNLSNQQLYFDLFIGKLDNYKCNSNLIKLEKFIFANIHILKY